MEQSKTFDLVAADQEQLTSNAMNLVEQANRAVVNTDKDMTNATDLVKFLKGCKKKADESRLKLTRPLKQVAKDIEAEFKKTTDPIDQAIAKVTGLMKVFANEQARIAEEKRQKEIREVEEKALREAEEIQRKAQEQADREAQEAQEKAEELAAAGDTDSADKLLRDQEAQSEQRKQEADEVAEQLVDNAATQSHIATHTGSGHQARGNYGASANTRRVRKWNVTDFSKIPAEFLLLNEKALRDNLSLSRDNFTHHAKTSLGLKGKELEAHVRAEMEKITLPGLEFYFENEISVR